MTDVSASCVKLVGWDYHSHSKTAPPFVDLIVRVESPTVDEQYKVRCTDVSDSGSKLYDFTFNHSLLSPRKLAHDETSAIKHLAAVYHRLIWGRPRNPNL